MKKLRCVIVDDEPVARKVLREFVGQAPYLVLVAEFDSVPKVEAFLLADTADLIFLDIEMPKRSGLQYLKAAPPSAARPRV
ncbi:MAG TPA: response regulator, partial [Puia sp.]|nr:response regulator [Puia sp.]